MSQLNQEEKIKVVPMEIAKLNYATMNKLQDRLSEIEEFHEFLLIEKNISIDEYMTEFLNLEKKDK